MDGRRGPLSGMAEAAGTLVERLTLPAREKRQLQEELVRMFADRERELAEARASVVREEAGGNWLQRSWRPLVMLVFAAVVLIGAFIPLPMLDDNSRFWDLLEIGLGGYILGRGVESLPRLFKKKKA